MPIVPVGILHSLSGTMAISEASLVEAELMAIAEINQTGGVLGHLIEPVIADGASDPTEFERNAKKLIQVHGVNTVFGGWTSASRKAVKPVFEKFNALLWYPLQYEGLECSQNIFYTGSCPNQQVEPAVTWLLQNKGTRFYLLGSDYVFPRTANKLIKAQLHQHRLQGQEGMVVGEEYVALGVQDFTNVIAKIQQAQPDVVFNTLNGDSNLAFYRQLKDIKINATEMPIMAVSVTESELQTIGNAAVGHYASWTYFQSLDTPKNRTFVANYQQRYGANRVTSDPIEAAYTQVYLWKQAVETAQSFEVDRVREAAYGQVFEAPGGLIRIEQNHHTWKKCQIGQILSNGQFEIVFTSNNLIKPLPWLGVEEIDFSRAAVVMDMLAEIPQEIHYNWQLEQKSHELEATTAQLHQEIAERQRTEERYRGIFENAAEGIFQTAPEGYYLSANPALAKIYGYASAEELKTSLTNVEQQLYVNPSRRAEFVAAMEQYSVVSNFESQIYRKDASIIWISENTRAVRDSQGKLLYYEGIVEDISERKRTEEILKLSEAKYRDLVQTVNCIITRWDTQGRFIFLNEYGQKFFGYEEKEIIGRHITGTIVPETETSGRDLRILMADITKNPERYLLNENENIRRNGERVWVSWANKPILNEQGELIEILSVGTDATERKRSEAALKQAKEAAEVANRAKSEFLSKMSHELRTPLNAILGFTQVLARDSSLNQEQQEQLEIINRSGEHLLTLINDVLEMSKIEAGRITLNETSFDLYRLLDSLEEMLQLKAETKGLQLMFNCAPDVPQYVQTDESKLRQVLINLLGNAIKFTQVGSVTLSVSLVVDHSLLVTAKESTTNNEQQITDNQQLITIQFEVADTGSGIAPDELDTLFEAFVQTESGRKSQEGTGLGLPISQQFVSLMGGEIKVSSTLEQGTIFRVNLPIKLAQATDVQTLQPKQRVIALEPGQPVYRILVVEDRWENRQLLVKLLTPLGFEVREATNGQEGVALWKSWEPHLIWMDMRMPIMDGYEATKQIKAQLQGQATVVIALTASALEEERSIVLSAGCDDFMRKPFQVSVLFEKLAQHLGVRYIYEQKQETGSRKDKNIEIQTSVEALAAMPEDWIVQLHKFAMQADAQMILQLIEQLPKQNAPLVHGLTDLVNNFRFDTIVDLTQALQHEQ